MAKGGDNVMGQELISQFQSDLTFGTAGLRAKMEPGFARINSVTIQLASQVFYGAFLWIK